MKPLFSFIAAIVLSLAAGAQTTPYKDWMTSQGPDEVFAKEACLAATNVVTGTHRSQLLLSFTKDRQTVPQLLLKVWDQQTPESQLTVKVSSKVSYPLFLWKASNNPEEPSVYWYAPIGWQPLMDHIAAANNLNIQGSEAKLAVSLRGSAVSLQRMAACLNAKEILPLDFLKKLNAKTDSSASVYRGVDEMIAGNEKTFEAYRLGILKTKELADVRKSMATLVAEETKASQRLQTAQGNLNKTQDSLQQKLQAQGPLEQKISQLNLEISGEESLISPLRQTFEQKKAIFTPVSEEYRPYVARAERADQALKENSDKLARLQSRLAEIDNSIPALRNRQIAAQREIVSLQGRLRQQQSDYEDARRKASFNVHQEVQNRLRSDFTYINYKNQADRARRDADRLRSESFAARSNLQTAEARVRECRATPGKDCTALEHAVRERQARLNEIERAQSSAEREAYFAQNNADMIERRTQSEVENTKREWERVASNLYNQYQETQRDINRLESEEVNLRGRITSLEDERRRSSDQIQILYSQRPSLQQEQTTAREERERARTRLDYDRIYNEYATAQKALISAEEKVKGLRNTLYAAQNDLASLRKDIESLRIKETAQIQERDAASATLADIQNRLQPARGQETALVQALADLAVVFENGKASYQRSYESWIAPVATWMAIGTF